MISEERKAEITEMIITAYKEKNLIPVIGSFNIDNIRPDDNGDWVLRNNTSGCCPIGALLIGTPKLREYEESYLASVTHLLGNEITYAFVAGFDCEESYATRGRDYYSATVDGLDLFLFGRSVRKKLIELEMLTAA